MRLIDADDIDYESIDSSDTSRYEYYYGTGIMAVRKEDIDAMPTIEERKTGRWIEFPNHNAYKCSECGRIIETVDGKHNVYKHYPYCHCGAKMERQARMLDAHDLLPHPPGRHREGILLAVRRKGGGHMKRRTDLPIILSHNTRTGVMSGPNRQWGGRDLFIVGLNKEIPSGQAYDWQDIGWIKAVLHFADKDALRVTIDTLTAELRRWEKEAVT